MTCKHWAASIFPDTTRGFDLVRVRGLNDRVLVAFLGSNSDLLSWVMRSCEKTFSLPPFNCQQVLLPEIFSWRVVVGECVILPTHAVVCARPRIRSLDSSEFL